ncbi:MAG: 2-C-methyl-D-erythritol 4-phosphate cytidylyltransferase [Rhodanobacteraceae bacterium]|nr:2-C-methyl-D-erythritol 4-phosphate cytidylyltransferase [Rhodanobacteraceae bacterium]
MVPAAGSGRRFGAELPKQYALIDGRPLLRWTLERLAAVPQLSGLMVVLAADDPHWPGWDAISGKPLLTAIGGAERADSVLSGLRALPAVVGDNDFVLVHDAARPCVRPDDIERLTRLAGAADGGLLAAPVRDTLKRSTDGRAVEQTVPRSELWRALTPQMFRRGALVRALEGAIAQDRQPTDEAQAIEWAGGRPLLVEGAEDNLKVTTARDLALAEWLLGEAVKRER